ncbi:Uncharacterized protein SCG7109_AV_00030 [Chlamydiales bacterium SCGC AG-110-M15]|nr:Uncharacterized protein SCG7109_AV_00030 [Chlamydiales bacterium SCGC AG-110-M15]
MTQEGQEATSAVEVLALLHQLSLTACRSRTRQSLIFQILNDSVQLAGYDRATLWSLKNGKPKLLGISGQAEANQGTGIAETWNSLVNDMKAPDTPQTVTKDSFATKEKLWLEFQASPASPNVHWFPIFSNKELVLGFWLERWGGVAWQDEEINILNFLMQAYGVAWEKFMPKYTWKSFGQKQALLIAAACFAALFLVHIPLRIVAPCEIVPKDPLMISAPLDGIVEEMLVKPGQYVKKDELLFSYDKRVPTQELKVAQKQVQIIQSELNRAVTLAFKDNRPLSEVATLRIKLQKEEIRLELAEFQVSRLEAKAPLEGIVMLDNPEAWRGRPVRIGERVMVLSDPNKSKVRIWIPESDNVVINREKPLKIFLNVSPEFSYQAELSYIADYSTVSDAGIPSFVSEAEWLDGENQVKMGLKGTVILYGQEVTLFYWIVRRPWAAVRSLFGF